jgi:sodium pump decarboxylase gamma subunit
MFDPKETVYIGSALILMVAGMGMTFIFLLVQILFTNLSSKISARFAHLIPEPAPKKNGKPTPAKTAPPPAAADEGEVVAAIVAAIHAAR